MSNASETTSAADGVAGLVARFDTADTLKEAAARVRQEGFTRWDVHSPFPVHGIERAMGIRPTPLPWLVLAAGIAGGIVALLMQWWMNAVDYPLIISGKPLFSLPANIPITFELIILFSALAAFGGAMALGRLPQFAHFVFRSEDFHRVTTDGFFISIAASDPKFDEAATPELLQSFGARAVEISAATAGGRSFPKALPWILAVAAALALLPPLLIARARQGKSDQPRIHLIRDMDFQPRYNPQSYGAFFADRRTMRPPAHGTVAVGNLDADEHFYLGYRTGKSTPEKPGEADRLEEPDYFTTFPAQVSNNIKELMTRGRQRFDIYCAPCHGLLGDGNGMVSIRAFQREEADWVRPTSLHTGSVRQQSVGKMFNTISNGTGKMPGYAAQIPVEDRWAIVLYERALQRSQNASIQDVPREIRPQLR